MLHFRLGLQFQLRHQPMHKKGKRALIVQERKSNFRRRVKISKSIFQIVFAIHFLAIHATAW